MLKIMLKPHHSVIRRARQRVSDTAGHVVHVGYAGARRTPMPRALRAGLRERLVWRRDLLEVPVDKILLGGQNRIDGVEYATATGDLLWGSTPVSQGPHAQLLALAEGHVELSDEQILATGYAAMARRCIALSGQYFDAVDEVGIVSLARAYVARTAGCRADDDETRPAHATVPGVPIRVAPIKGSDCYQVMDGHHRVAAAAHAGHSRVTVQVNRISRITALMHLMNQMTWIGGAREKYQPLEVPELATWPTVRACTDRLEKMLATAAGVGLAPEHSTYLDVASCYGWFVAQMEQAGFSAQGLERDPLAPDLGRAVYGLSPDRITTGDAVDVLASTERRWDIVSCFSLLHHFELGRASVGAEELVALLDRVTSRVLVLDTGQEHESWFTESLAGWDSAYVREFLATHTTFDRIVDLGPDTDDRPPYAGNYGRHLFACIRDTTPARP